MNGSIETQAAVPGTVVPIGVQVTPAGQQGPSGNAAMAVSTDASNVAVLGSDSKIYVPDPAPEIGLMRLRSFNAIGNPTFEVDQRNIGQSSGLGAGRFVQDRWYAQNTLSASAGQNAAASTDGLVPGTNFKITNNFLRVTLLAQFTTLAATDNLSIYEAVEGCVFRELSNDVHSIGILVRSTVAGLSFGLTLRDNLLAYSLPKLCTIPSANVWTLITLPNLPMWTSSGTFPKTPGVSAYLLTIGLALGSNFLPPSNNTWIAGNFVGAMGQSNFANNPVNSTFDIAFVQHEPGPLCTTLIDKPFTQNLDEVKRYYQKAYSYPTLPGTAVGYYRTGIVPLALLTNVMGIAPFEKGMARAPTTTIYSPSTGNPTSALNISTGAPYSVTSQAVDNTGIIYLNIQSGAVAGHVFGFLYTADTGW